MDPTATIIITSALVFYSIGVWSERIQGQLKWWHLVFFVLGLICDTWGTGMMFEMAGGLTFDVHGITGLIAIVLMFIHALWALAVLRRNDESHPELPQIQCGGVGDLADPLLQPDVFQPGRLGPPYFRASASAWWARPVARSRSR